MPGRRDFLAAGVGMSAAGVLPQHAQGRRPSKMIDEDDPANIKLTHRLNARTVTDGDLLFLKQIGVKWARLDFGGEDTPLEFMRAIQERCSRYGVRIFSGVHLSFQSPAITLGLSGRDKDIETYCRFVQDLGRLGIPVASYDYLPGNTYTTNIVERRGYATREFDLADFRARVEKQRYEREYSAEEIWSGYTYFIKAVLPVAEKAGVKLALHPDDPPIEKMNGVHRIFGHYDGFRRAEQIAGSSPNWGLLFCVGTWSEGGNQMGKNVFEMIRDFGGRGKIFEVHFRNVSGPLPRFVETFPDDGYMDMYQVMKALREVRFNGAAEPDHVPKLAGDQGMLRAGTAYCFASMRALLRRANEEVG